MNERPFRAYSIDRDAQGLPFRMVWQGDYRTVPVHEWCPRLSCNGRKLINGRCLTCWGDWSHITKQVRVR